MNGLDTEAVLPLQEKFMTTESKERHRAATKAAMARPEVKARLSAAMKDVWARPDAKARRSATMKGVWASARQNELHLECSAHVASFNKKGGRALGLPEGDYSFEYAYPLTNKTTFTHTLNSTTTKFDLLRLIRQDYEEIYRVEGEDPGHAPGMYNRARSHGCYGIWGHDIGDLLCDGITITDKRVSLLMGS